MAVNEIPVAARMVLRNAVNENPVARLRRLLKGCWLSLSSVCLVEDIKTAVAKGSPSSGRKEECIELVMEAATLQSFWREEVLTYRAAGFGAVAKPTVDCARHARKIVATNKLSRDNMVRKLKN